MATARFRTIHKKLDQTDSVIFMSPGPAELVPGPVVINDNRTYSFYCKRTTSGNNWLVNQSCSCVTDSISTGASSYLSNSARRLSTHIDNISQHQKTHTADTNYCYHWIDTNPQK